MKSPASELGLIFQSSTHKITVVFRLRRDFVERKIVDQLRINKYTATGGFGRFC